MLPNNLLGYGAAVTVTVTVTALVSSLPHDPPSVTNALAGDCRNIKRLTGDGE